MASHSSPFCCCCTLAPTDEQQGRPHPLWESLPDVPEYLQFCDAVEPLIFGAAIAVYLNTAVADAITIIATTLHHHHHHQLAHHRQHLCPSLTFMFLRWPCCAWSFFNFPFSLCAIGRMRTRLMKVTVEVTMATTMMASVDHFPRGLDPSTERK